jgi:DNA-binding transcriptional LysR family regulator
METQQLKGFLAVAKEKSFSKGAKRVHRTQAAVSLQVKQLEETLGARLFDRSNPRAMSLTPEGETLLTLATPLLRDFEGLKERFDAERGKSLVREIRIATHEPVITYLLPSVIKAFKKSHPDTKITLLRKSREEALGLILNGEVDFAISAFKKVPAAVDYRVIGRYDRVLVGPKDHPLARMKKIGLQDIVKYPLLLPPGGSATRLMVDNVFKKAGLEYDLALEATGRQAIKTYIDLGFGISVFNEMLITREEKKKYFVVNAARYFGQSERAIIKRKGKFLSAPLKQLIQMISGSARELLL